MNVNKVKIIYITVLLFLAISLFSAFVVLLVYYNDTAWIGLTVVFILWYIISVIVSFRVFNSKRMANVKLCWIMCIMCIPFLGLICFLWFGTFPFKKKRFKEYTSLQLEYYDEKNFTFTRSFLNNKDLAPNIRKTFKYALNIYKPVYNNNKITLLDDIDVLYSEFMQETKKAKKFINVQTYIVRESNFFNMFADLLIKKAKEGVVVNFMYDWFGSLIKKPKNKIKEMKKAGINVAIFNTFLYNPFSGQTNYRSHRKCLIIDNKVAIYGGSNLSDDYFDIQKGNNFWKDINLKIEGNIVNSMNIVYATDWENYSLNSISNKLKKQFKQNKAFYFPKFDEIINKSNNDAAQFVESCPLFQENVIHDTILNMIGMANKRLWITTPYFYPSDDILNQLVAAKYAGVDVRIILPGNVDDKKYILLVNRHNYKRLLDAGVKIYEYYGFFHGKEIIIDDDLALLGTFNFDHRSLYSNFETALIVNSESTNIKLRTEYEKFIGTSKKITLEQWEKWESRWNTLRLNIFNLIHPLF